ncbi:MAG: glycoside hydrolase family 18 [Herbinix sp.]|jgi:chitinase|nr:glycoside hydrolase family 18 [Herbinix sp.]
MKLKLKMSRLMFMLILFVITTIFSNIVMVQAATIQLSRQTISLETGASKILSVSGTRSKVTWSTSKKSVATVSTSGKVTAKAVGTATIYATIAGRKLSCKVTVKTPIKISSTSATLYTGSTKTLQITGTTSKVTWSTGNKSVATVSSGGKVTAKAQGTATIYAFVAGKKLSSKITVKEPIKISNTSVNLYTGATKTLKISGTTSTITWITSNKSIATVSTGGKVTAKAVGTVTITASVAGRKLTSKITVKNPPTTTTEDTITSMNENLTPIPSAIPVNTQIPSTGSDRKVVGYYAAWARYSGFTPDKIDAGKLTHINYAFANISSDLKLALGYPDIDPANISQLNLLKKSYPNLKTIIAVGGWTWSGRFSDVSFTAESRSTFADSCVEFIVKYGFDGIDIDWEYPVSGGLATNGKRPEDKYNFTLLLQTLREKLDARGEIDQKHYILTFAGAAGNWYVNNTELSRINQFVDYANVMTYDIHGLWEPITNFNAPLFSHVTKDNPYNVSVSSSIDAWIRAGFAKEKIVMGVPFYGFIYKAVEDNNQGLYRSYSGGASISYGNIAGNYLNNPEFERFFHSVSLVPWLFNGSTFITYDDEQSMSEKAKFMKEKGLGGVMIWELSQDPNRVLLNSLYQELHQ